MSFFDFMNLSLLAAQQEASPLPSRQSRSRDPDQPHVIDPFFALPSVLPSSLSPPHVAAVLGFLSALSNVIMEQTVGSTSSEPPPAPRHKTSNLPELGDAGAASSSQNATPQLVEVNENTDLASLTPAQLYDLNQELLNEAAGTDRPLIASVAPMDVLRAEYEHGSQSFVKQIEFLQKQGYHGIRRTRGDGDCFYRSLAFAYIERIMNASDRPLAVMSAISTLEATLPMLDAAGFQKMVYEDFFEIVIDLIRRIETPDAQGKTLTHEALLEAFQDPGVSNYVVVYLRLLTSARIRTDPESYEPFLIHPELGEPVPTRDFCEAFVEAIGKEADHVQVTALSRALKINVKVAYLDGRDKNGHVDFVEFRNARDENEDPLVLLYRPGHYDILDKRSIEALSL